MLEIAQQIYILLSVMFPRNFFIVLGSQSAGSFVYRNKKVLGNGNLQAREIFITFLSPLEVDKVRGIFMGCFLFWIQKGVRQPDTFKVHLGYIIDTFQIQKAYKKRYFSDTKRGTKKIHSGYIKVLLKKVSILYPKSI